MVHSEKDNQALLSYPRIVCVALFIFSKTSLLLALVSTMSSLSFQAISVHLKYFISSQILIFHFPFLPARGLSTSEQFLISLILPDFQFLFQFQFQVVLFTAPDSSSLPCPDLSRRIVCPRAIFSLNNFKIPGSSISNNEK